MDVLMLGGGGGAYNMEPCGSNNWKKGPLVILLSGMHWFAGVPVVQWTLLFALFTILIKRWDDEMRKTH